MTSVPASRRPFLRRVLRYLAPLVVLGLAAGIWQRERLWIWYCAERLERASDDGRGDWAEKLAASGEPALPALLKLLRHENPSICQAAKGALETITTGWAKDDSRCADFAHRFMEAEPRFSTPGRAAALDLLPVVLAYGDSEVPASAKRMIARAARGESADGRIHAVAAALRLDVDCLEAVAPLLYDPVVEVRRAAVLALGAARDVGRPAIGDDDLLRCLHDSDGEVRRLGEMGLRSRGRSARDIRFGRRYSAPDAAERQKLLLDLADEDDLDVTVWLERLTADADPAVRAGAARLAVERQADLRDRIALMSRADPDGTVRRIAAYYLQKLVVAR